jgi:pentatricopeptide repeat protein
MYAGRESTLVRVNYSVTLESLRQFAEAESLLAPGVRDGRVSRLTYSSLLMVFLEQGKLDDAATTFRLMHARFPEQRADATVEVQLAWARRDTPSATRIADSLSRSADPPTRDAARFYQAMLSATQGQLGAAAREVSGSAQQSRMRINSVRPSTTLMLAKWDAALANRPERAAMRLDSAVAEHPLGTGAEIDRPYLSVALAYAMAGRPDRARQVVKQFETEVRDTALKRSLSAELQAVRGEILMAENKPREALSAFRQSDTLSDGPAEGCIACFYARLGRAFDKMGLADSATAMYERYLSAPSAHGLVEDADPLLLAPLHRRLGELYEAKGDRSKAIAHYAQFVELWKRADPELQPQVADVKRRLEALRAADRGR